MLWGGWLVVVRLNFRRIQIGVWKYKPRAPLCHEQGNSNGPTSQQSAEEVEFFAELDGLGTAFGAEFVENAAGMGLDGVFADE